MESIEEFDIRQKMFNKGCRILDKVISKNISINYICLCGKEKRQTYDEFINNFCDDCGLNSPPTKRRKLSFD
jgi:hypothetical protein